MYRRLVLALLLLACLPRMWGARAETPNSRASASHLTSLVDPFVGTAGTGNTFPGASLPHGMIQWSPESTAGGLVKPGGYQSGDLIIRGFGVTHLSGAGCVAFENVPIMPTVRPIRSAPQPNGSPYSDRFVQRSQWAHPGSYGVQLNSGISVELAVTARTGLARIWFPRSREASVLIDAGNGAAGRTTIDGVDHSSIRVVDRRTVTGAVTGGHFCGLGNRYTLFFAIRFSRPFASAGAWRDGRLQPGGRSASVGRSGAYARFDTRRDQVVEMQIGLSYVSVAGAFRNLATERPGWDERALQRRANSAWEGVLDRVRVHGGTAAEQRIFYTALYHSLLAPTTFSDVDGRYPGFDGHIHRAQRRVQYANFSGWDIYRSEMQLLAWLEPQRAGDMAQSLIADAAQGGALPKWPVANAYTGEMDGDSADPMLADVLAFAGPRFDVPAALRAMVRGADGRGVGIGGYQERPGGASYRLHGWVAPQTGGWGSAATTLEFATDDFSIAQVAQALHRTDLARMFTQRSHQWRALWDPASKLIRPRSPSGAFLPDFGPTDTAGFVEGTAAQYVWMVPHDLRTLIRLLGGRAAAIRRLDTFFTTLDAGPTGEQYWAGNETDLEAPWEFDAAGAPRRTQAVVREIETACYSDTPAGLPGNDDLGELSSWYVWAAMGLYPEIPGVAGFAVGSPLFPRIDLQVAGGRTVTILAPGAATRRPYVQAVWLNGHPYRSSWLPLDRLGRHAVVRFRGIDATVRPHGVPGTP